MKTVTEMLEEIRNLPSRTSVRITSEQNYRHDNSFKWYVFIEVEHDDSSVQARIIGGDDDTLEQVVTTAYEKTMALLYKGMPPSSYNAALTYTPGE